LIPPEELLELRLEGRSTTSFDRTLPKIVDRAVPDETAAPPREGSVFRTDPDTEPERLPAEAVFPVEVQVRFVDLMPEGLVVEGLLRVPLEIEPLSLMVAREPAPESDLPETGDPSAARPTAGRMVG